MECPKCKGPLEVIFYFRAILEGDKLRYEHAIIEDIRCNECGQEISLDEIPDSELMKVYLATMRKQDRKDLPDLFLRMKEIIR